MTAAIPPALQTLLDALRCPACSAVQSWQIDDGPARITCGTCGLAHTVRDGVVHVNIAEPHPEVVQERASVPATEMAPELGGWREVYTPSTDPQSDLGRAYLSLPHGNDSAQFAEPGYFQNVRRFAAEFDFVVSHLPTSGALLDVGADGTWSTAQLARRGLQCIALDITDHLTLAHLFQTACPPYALVNVDMHEPVFRNGAFDAVTAFNAMHHSKRLDALAGNLARVLKPGGVLAFVEPYVQNAEQEAAFGAPQSALGINENVHTIGRWHRAFVGAGLVLSAYGLSDSFNAVYRKPHAAAHAPSRTEAAAVTATGGAAAADSNLVLHDYYDAALTALPGSADTAAGRACEFAVTVESGGRAAWASRGPLPVRLSYHVSRITGEGATMLAFDNERTLLPAFVGPGRPQSMAVPVTLTEPGVYDVEFDLVHEARCWFKERGARTATVRLVVR